MYKTMTKYYTPHIDEFHNGFEYEVFQKGEINDEILTTFPVEKENVWHKYKIPDPFLGYNFSKLLQLKLRVKYLNTDDVLSLGFQLSAEGKDKRLFSTVINEKYEPEHIKLTLIFEGDIPIISISKNGISVIEEMVCKNKSELKWILNRLSII